MTPIEQCRAEMERRRTVSRRKYRTSLILTLVLVTYFVGLSFILTLLDVHLIG